MLRSIITASVIAAAAFGTVGAHAQDANRTAVSTQGVDFNNPSDVNALYSRIRVAADVVCTSQGPTDIATAKYEKACVADAVSTAVDDVNQPQLTRLAQGASGANAPQLAMRDRRDGDARGTR